MSVPMVSPVSSTSLETLAASASAAILEATELLDVHGSSSWLGIIGRSILVILQLISSIIYWSLRLTTFSLPTIIFTTLSASWTVTMNATTLMVIVVLFCSAVAWVVRYRFLNMYSRLPHEPQRKEPNVDLPPDSHDEGVKSGFSNYLDEFLSAIKIFGYLERSVFHELTRSMQTKRLVAGEAVNLEEEKGFCIVVDGLVEIFVKSGPRSSYDDAGMDEGESSDYDYQQNSSHQYQLLTEVRNGTPMSSLFSIMSLFTEDINLGPGDSENKSSTSFSPTDSFSGHNKDLSSAPGTPPMRGARSAHLQSPVRMDTDNQDIPTIDLSEVADESLSGHHRRRPPLRTRGTSKSAHPDIIARATTDTTLAIIPASAFRRLIKVYPRATAHIVHVILSRFQRVTLSNAYNYLGLTDDVIRTESSMTRFTFCQLPNDLRGEALNRLKEKFRRERDNSRENGEDPKVIALHNPTIGRRRRSSAGLRKEAVLQSLSRQITDGPVGSTITRPRDRGLASSSDIVGPNRLPRRVDTYGTAPRSPFERPGRGVIDPFAKQGSRKSIDPRESVNEDNVFRASVLECMFRALGLGQSALSSDGAESHEGSPKINSFDLRYRPGPTNAFGLMGPLETGSGGDTESQASGSTSAFHSPSAHVLASDMRDDLEILYFPKGSVLVEEGEHSTGLYYVIDGFLDMGTTKTELSAGIIEVDPSSYMPASPLNPTDNPAKHPDIDTQCAKKRARKSIALIKPGGLAGYIGGVTSYRSFIDVRAKTDVYVGFLPRASLERIVDKFPIVLLTMAKRLTSILPRLILHIDFALEWVQVNAGQVLFHQDEESEAIYIVLNGRLRLVEEKNVGRVNVLAEYGQGESVGELEVMTESTRPGTLHAIRDTELVKFPRTLFNSLAQEHPNITMKVSKIIASRMRKLIEDPTTLNFGETLSSAVFQKGFSTNNLRTVAILPVTNGVPVMDFSEKLMGALGQISPPNGAVRLNQDSILNHLGKHAFNRMGKLKLAQYLADLEEKHSLVLYVADTNVNSPWTQTCITQADSILLVALADGSPDIGEYERLLLGMKSTARKTLILLHAERFSNPGLTRSWLRNRMWVNGGHYHMQMPIRSGTMPVVQPRRLGSALKERVQIIQAEIQKFTNRKVRPGQYYPPESPSKGDFNRLARRLCGKSIGLVLGGGGARGIAHIGVIRALEEAGIPVDLIGGTSIGSFVGALYARHADVVPMFGLAKKFAGRMASIWRFAFDLTYPSASYTTGHEFNRGIFKIFGNTQIEDFWLEYYCNTTNISKSRQEIHTSGYAWRYIRASMSLAGLLPPLCDEGSMLLDGGYIDNLTVAHMKSLGAATVIAVDVGAIDDSTPQTYGDSLSGLWAFFNRWNLLSSHPNPPTLSEIQARLAYVSSVDALERAKMMPGCIYMRPPIDDYGTLDFGKFDEIYNVGYEFGKDFVEKLRDEGKLPLQQDSDEASKALHRTMAPRRASI